MLFGPHLSRAVLLVLAAAVAAIPLMAGCDTAGPGLEEDVSSMEQVSSSTGGLRVVPARRGGALMSKGNAPEEASPYTCRISTLRSESAVAAGAAPYGYHTVYLHFPHGLEKKANGETLRAIFVYGSAEAPAYAEKTAEVLPPEMDTGGLRGVRMARCVLPGGPKQKQLNRRARKLVDKHLKKFPEDSWAAQNGTGSGSTTATAGGPAPASQPAARRAGTGGGASGPAAATMSECEGGGERKYLVGYVYDRDTGEILHKEIVGSYCTGGTPPSGEGGEPGGGSGSPSDCPGTNGALGGSGMTTLGGDDASQVGAPHLTPPPEDGSDAQNGSGAETNRAYEDPDGGGTSLDPADGDPTPGIDDPSDPPPSDDGSDCEEDEDDSEEEVPGEIADKADLEAIFADCGVTNSSTQANAFENSIRRAMGFGHRPANGEGELDGFDTDDEGRITEIMEAKFRNGWPVQNNRQQSERHIQELADNYNSGLTVGAPIYYFVSLYDGGNDQLDFNNELVSFAEERDVVIMHLKVREIVNAFGFARYTLHGKALTSIPRLNWNRKGIDVPEQLTVEGQIGTFKGGAFGFDCDTD